MANNIYNISSYQNYCHELHKFINKNYKNINDLVILLTSKRLCRDLKNYFAADDSNIFLPQIKTIADINYNDFWIVNSNTSIARREINLAIADYLQYKILSEVEEIFYIAEIVVKNKIFSCSNNLDRAVSIAKNLRHFFNDIANESISDIDFSKIDDSDLSNHRQLTLSFLTEFYIKIRNNLLRDKIILSSDKSNFIITKIIDLIRSHNLANPLIIAGSTASSKINRNFITQISNQANGVVILNNYLDIKDCYESDPQYYNNKLIQNLNLPKDHKIINLDQSSTHKYCKIRKLLTDNIFIKSQNINDLQLIKNDKRINKLKKDITENFTLIQGSNEYEEAYQICNILANNNDKKIAVISSDNNFCDILARQLDMRQIRYNNSISHPIDSDQFLIFINLINEFLINEFDANLFLAINKNILCKYSKDEDLILKFEIEVLRQQLSDKTYGAIEKKVDELQDIELIKFWQSFNHDLTSFTNNINSIASHFNMMIKLIENLTNDNWSNIVSNSCAANEIFDFFARINQQKNLECDYHQFVSIFNDIAKNYSFFKKTNSNLNIQLLSPIEARMINCDIIILCALNDAIFPARESENWLGKKIRKSLNIENSLKQIGVNAFDFCHYLSAPKVILSRHESSDNAVKLASQFWLRFQLFCQFLNIDITMIKEKRLYRNNNNYNSINIKYDGYLYGQNIDQISITEIVKLIKNPYYIYAKKILKLKELPKIDYQPSFSEFGSFIHKVFEVYIGSNKKNEKFKEIFLQYFLNYNSLIIWWPKFQKIYENFILNNQQYQNCKNLLEKYLEADISGKKIYGKIDRMIINQDSSIEIIDYKTGITPSKKDFLSLKEPQLVISALLAIDNNLSNISHLKYWKLSIKNHDIQSYCSDKINKMVLDARKRIKEIVNYYFIENNKFKPAKNDQFDCYRHLARNMKGF